MRSDGKCVLVVDLDGTSLNDEGILPAENKEALNSFAASGGTLIVSTGRSRSSALDVLDGVDLSDGFLTCDNGCTVFKRGCAEGFELPGISSFDVETALRFAKNKNCRVNVFTDCNNYAPIYLRNIPQCLANIMRRLTGSRSRAIASLHALISKHGDERVKKIWLRGLLCDDLPFLNEALSSSTAYLINDYGVVEVASNGSSKLAAVELILEKEKIKPECVYVVGDDGNDLCLFQRFPNSFAVGNARDEVKAAANCVVATNNAFGVAEVVNLIEADRRRG